MRVLHAPVNVGNQPWVISRHERLNGIKSDLIVNYGTWLNYPADRILSEYRNTSWKSIIKRAAWGFSSILKYDVFHYYFGRSLLYWDDWPELNKFPFYDLKLAKKLGKKVIMTLQGCDVRIASQSNKNNKFTPCAENHCRAFNSCISAFDKQRIELINNILPLCDKIFYLNPELGHFVKRGEFLPYANVELNKFEVIPPNINRPVRIVHAPSDPSTKGTDYIIGALNELQNSHDFELILVKNKPYEEALELYKSADIAIDQILCGWYGGFSVEMMAMGKPVLCYIRDQDLVFVPKQMRDELPIYNIRPDNLVEDIDFVLRDKNNWRERSGLSRKFVDNWHDPQKIAEYLISIYKSK